MYVEKYCMRKFCTFAEGWNLSKSMVVGSLLMFNKARKGSEKCFFGAFLLLWPSGIQKASFFAQNQRPTDRMNELIITVFVEQPPGFAWLY